MFQIWVVGRGRRPEGPFAVGKWRAWGEDGWSLVFAWRFLILGSRFLSPTSWPFGPLSHWYAFQVCIHEWHQLLLGLLRPSWWVKVGSKAVVAPSSGSLTPVLRASCKFWVQRSCVVFNHTPLETPKCLYANERPEFKTLVLWNAFMQMRDLNSRLWYSPSKEGEHRTGRGSPGSPFTREGDSYLQHALSSRWGFGSSEWILCPFHSPETELWHWPPAFLHTTPQGSVTLAAKSFSSALLRPALLPCSPVPALRNGVRGTCSLGTWPRWSGWGRQLWAPLSGFSWTPHVSFCVGREFVPVFWHWPEPKVSLGDSEPLKGLDGGEAMGLGQEFCSLKGLCNIAPLNVFWSKISKYPSPWTAKSCPSSHWAGKAKKVPGSSMGWGRN